MKRRHSQLTNVLELYHQGKPYHLCLNDQPSEWNSQVLRMLNLRGTLSPPPRPDSEQQGYLSHLREQLSSPEPLAIEKLNQALDNPALMDLLPVLLKVLNSQ